MKWNIAQRTVLSCSSSSAEHFVYPRNTMSQRPQQRPALVPNRNSVRFLKLNSYDDIKTLVPPRTICQSNSLEDTFQISDIAPFLGPLNDEYKVFLRFCKPVRGQTHQLDCLPKSFNLMINRAAFHVKIKNTDVPMDLTSKFNSGSGNNFKFGIYINPSDETTNESQDEFCYGLFLVKKMDHKMLLETFRNRFKKPIDRQVSIDLVKRKLNPGDNEDEIAIVENENLIKVSLLCPITSTRISLPARSIACDHVHCFEAKTFIEMNEITNRWKCPHCKIFIKFTDLVLDGYFMEILKSSPPNCEEAEIYPDGQYKYVLGDVSGYPAVSPSDLAPSSSCSAKRKLAENSASSHMKKQTKEVECITIYDSDDEEESGRNTSSSTLSSISINNEDDSDDDIEIVYEKIVTVPSSAPIITFNNNNNTSSTSRQQPMP